MSRTQVKPYYKGIFEKYVLLLHTIHIYVENTWAKWNHFQHDKAHKQGKREE